jgi:hypothetical protein
MDSCHIGPFTQSAAKGFEPEGPGLILAHGPTLVGLFALSRALCMHDSELRVQRVIGAAANRPADS